jgi:pSer/pThr/pTyr-binding forkhead associated (FHA) protein
MNDLSKAVCASTPIDLEAIAPAPARDTSNDVIHLRERGTDRIHRLPQPPHDWLVGTSEACALRLTDLRVSPEHALITHERQQWWIRDLGSAAGLRQDGTPCKDFALDPGVEISVGPTTLIAESLRSVALRKFCVRVLGWNRDPKEVDHALRAIRFAASHRTALILRGKGDLVPLAWALHRRTLGVDSPFIVCDPRRRNAPASIRSTANHNSERIACVAASGGSLCVRSSRLPRDSWALLPLRYEPDTRMQLIVCMDRDDRGVLLAGPGPIQVPPLRERRLEIPRIVKEYAAEAIAALRAPAACFTAADLRWVVDHAASSLDEIEKATLRVVAIKSSYNPSQAAELLGMAPVSLVRWLGRRSSRLTKVGVARARRPKLNVAAR